MHKTCAELLDALVKTDSCSNAAKLLHAVVAGVSAERRMVELHEVACKIRDMTYSKLDAYCCDENRNPFYVASGMEANLMYIICEIGTSFSDEPRWTLAKLDYLASRLEEANDNTVGGLNRSRTILEHCFKTYACMHKARMMVVAFPDLDIDCVAEHAYHDDIPITFINAKHSGDRLVETFTYEAAALLIAGDDIPSEAQDLMRKTAVPDVDTLPEESAFGNYLLCLKLGLSYKGPYSQLVERISDDPEHARAWHDYVLNLL